MQPTASNIFNDVILGYIILFFSKNDLFSEFSAGAGLNQIAEWRGFEKTRLKVILRSAESMGVLRLSNESYHLTALGEELSKNRYAFTVMMGGYSELLDSMDLFLAAPASSWKPYVRGDYVAIGSNEAHEELMRPIFNNIIDALPATCIADLGCGNAGRLVELLGRRRNLTGVGIDIDSKAIEVAEKNRERHNLTKRLTIIRENVFDSLTQPHPEFESVELVTSFMMLHDLFNIPELQGQLFARMKAAFPAAKYFVLADTCLDEKTRDASTMPIFTMGYELVHALRGIQVFPLSYYEDQFARGGLKIVARHDFGVPNTYCFVLEV